MERIARMGSVRGERCRKTTLADRRPLRRAGNLMFAVLAMTVSITTGALATILIVTPGGSRVWTAAGGSRFAWSTSNISTVSITFIVPRWPTSAGTLVWIGIQGLICMGRKGCLVQAGVASPAWPGSTGGGWFIEDYPAAMRVLDVPAPRPGDTVSVRIRQLGPDMWRVALADRSTGWTTTRTERHWSCSWCDVAQSAVEQTPGTVLTSPVHWLDRSALARGQAVAWYPAWATGLVVGLAGDFSGSLWTVGTVVGIFTGIVLGVGVLFLLLRWWWVRIAGHRFAPRGGAPSDVSGRHGTEHDDD